MGSNHLSTKVSAPGRGLDPFRSYLLGMIFRVRVNNIYFIIFINLNMI